MALVIHELVTNSAKYGSLSDSGTVDVDWKRNASGDLIVRWEEKGGPPVVRPTRKGFGSTIITRSVPYDLGGKASIEFAKSGVCAEFCIPGRHVSEAHGDRKPKIKFPRSAQGHPVAAPAHVLSGERVLLVEDSLIIALDAEDAIERLGADSVITASTVSSGLEAIESFKPTLAMLDINLGDSMSYAIADRLMEMGTPFIFASGYGEQAQLPEIHRYRTVLQKPYTLENIARCLDELSNRKSP